MPAIALFLPTDTRKLDCMHRELESVFAELGLAHYLDAFVDQGFDSWETILDIQESDLDALGVKLGHRRKLQRRIANARGIAPSISLVSALKPGSEEGKQQHLRRDNPPRSEAGSESTNGVTKRKYRRHPKPDEHAPERPPSAYVLFSNKMREDLKSHNLSFTEIAKLVGENWQNLDQAERESFENQANVAKDKYRRSLAEYKKTPEYRRYAQYLQEFKEKQNKHNQGSKAHLSTDTSKRQRFDGKREAARLRHDSSYGSTTSGGTNGTPSSGASGTASGSSSERLRESEPPPYRRRRVDSIASIAESQASSTAPTALSQRNSLDENAFSPRSSHIDGNSPVDGRYSQHSAAWYDRSNPSEHPTMPQQLPSLSDMLDKDNQQGISGRLAPDGSPSMGMGSSTSYPAEDAVRRSGGSKLPDSRPISEGALPIHALLSNQATSSARYAKAPQQRGPHMPNSKNTVESPHVSPGYGFLSNSPTFRHMKTEQSGDGDVVMTTERSPTNTTAEKGRFDGMSALLQAGEIVGRRGGRR